MLNTGIRDANPYLAEIAGVIAGSPQTFKPLNIQRAFVTYVENRTPQDRFFRFTLVPQARARPVLSCSRPRIPLD